jgi:hypothetical protein
VAELPVITVTLSRSYYGCRWGVQTGGEPGDTSLRPRLGAPDQGARLRAQWVVRPTGEEINLTQPTADKLIMLLAGVLGVLGARTKLKNKYFRPWIFLFRLVELTISNIITNVSVANKV